jgi:protein-disulfide isomerase
MNKIAAAVLCALIASPSFAAITRDELKKALEANPDLVLEALKKADKAAFFDVVVDAQKDYQMKKEKEAEEQEKKDLDAAFKNPYKPAIDEKTRFRGDKNAPITVVEYSDFECPYCSRGYQVLEQVRHKYGAKLRFVYKNLPLVAIHHLAMPAAQWFEAVAIQNPEKSFIFQDKMFQNQSQLGEEFFRKTVKDLGLDVKKAEKDRLSDAVQAKIEADVKEARQFGFSGTPGFLINGVPLRGAYPAEEFDKIIAKLGV